jgi:hypothetical protein
VILTHGAFVEIKAREEIIIFKNGESPMKARSGRSHKDSWFQREQQYFLYGG